jgi:hypothetical protein
VNGQVMLADEPTHALPDRDVMPDDLEAGQDHRRVTARLLDQFRPRLLALRPAPCIDGRLGQELTQPMDRRRRQRITAWLKRREQDARLVSGRRHAGIATSPT